MPDTNNTGAELKKVKDFNDEEKAAIAARAKRSELSRVAKDFGTSWQVVNAIQKAAQKSAKKTKSAATKAAQTRKSNAAKRNAPRNSRFTENERLAILQRATEIGVTNAAAEAGISKWTIFQWRKVLKKRGYDIPKASRKRSSSFNRTAANIQVNAAAVAKTDMRRGSYTPLEVENRLLKQQIENLTEQVKKLREALARLA